jgi:hypothetical protein
MQSDGNNGLQKQEIQQLEEGRTADDVKWVVVVLLVSREPERRGRNPSDSILFCELSEAAAVSYELARLTPPVRPVPCLSVGLEPLDRSDLETT